jgi:hypothetical protein
VFRNDKIGDEMGGETLQQGVIEYKDFRVTQNWLTTTNAVAGRPKLLANGNAAFTTASTSDLSYSGNLGVLLTRNSPAENLDAVGNWTFGASASYDGALTKADNTTTGVAHILNTATTSALGATFENSNGFNATKTASFWIKVISHGIVKIKSSGSIQAAYEIDTLDAGFTLNQWFVLNTTAYEKYKVDGFVEFNTLLSFYGSSEYLISYISLVDNLFLPYQNDSAGVVGSNFSADLTTSVSNNYTVVLQFRLPFSDSLATETNYPLFALSDSTPVAADNQLGVRFTLGQLEARISTARPSIQSTNYTGSCIINPSPKDLHTLIVKKSSTEGVVVYMDGIEYIRASTAPDIAASTSALSKFKLGSYTQSSSTSSGLDILFEKFILYNRVISDEEIRNLSFASIATTSGSGLSSALLSGLIKV